MLFLRSKPTMLIAAAAIAVTALLAGWPSDIETRVTASPIQLDISPAEFGDIINVLSEPEGYFDTDNFISNETSYLHVIGKLNDRVAPGSAYFGVGPEQNFSYIVHSEPSIAIVADIRRQNMLQHLLFKVLIQESDDRQDFLCRLFAKQCGPGDPDDALAAILDHLRPLGIDDQQLAEDLVYVPTILVEDYGIELTPEDTERIEYVHRSFVEAGIGVRFSSFGRSSIRYPSFTELMLETDPDGAYQSYLSSDALFDRLQQFQLENRLIPIVGDFAGDKALKAAASFLDDNGLPVSVFYTSNVEFYLFGTLDWESYLDNVRAFPFADDAVFIRSYFPTYGIRHPQNVPGHRPTTLIQSVQGFLDDATTGRLQSYWDLVSRNTY